LRVSHDGLRAYSCHRWQPERPRKTVFSRRRSPGRATVHSDCATNSRDTVSHCTVHVHLPPLTHHNTNHPSTPNSAHRDPGSCSAKSSASSYLAKYAASHSWCCCEGDIGSLRAFSVARPLWCVMRALSSASIAIHLTPLLRATGVTPAASEVSDPQRLVCAMTGAGLHNVVVSCTQRTLAH